MEAEGVRLGIDLGGTLTKFLVLESGEKRYEESLPTPNGSFADLLRMLAGKARELLSGRPTILVKDGVIDQKAMEKQGFTIPALMEQVREHGIQNLSEVGCAVLEISGQVNVFPIAAKRNITPEDLDLHPVYENLPLHLILDGKLQADSLRSAGLNADWLRQQLHRFKLGIENTYFCSLDTDGVICAQKKQEKRVHFAQALKPEEARW